MSRITYLVMKEFGIASLICWDKPLQVWKHRVDSIPEMFHVLRAKHVHPPFRVHIADDRPHVKFPDTIIIL